MFIIAIRTMCPSALISILMTGITHLICCAQWEKKRKEIILFKVKHLLIVTALCM